MNEKRIKVSDIRPEVIVSTARSGGPGGQHVNKVETKVILKFNVLQSQRLTDTQKERIIAKHGNKLTKEGELIVASGSQRSQSKNKEIAFKKLDRLMAQAFAIQKARKATRPTKASVEKRIKAKKLQSEKKKLRQKF